MSIATFAAQLAAVACIAGADYSGKYASDPRMQQLLRDLPAARTAALANVKSKLRLEPKRADRIRIEVVDALPAEAEKLAPFEGSAFTTETEGSGSDAPIVVTLRAEFLMNGLHELDDELRHELVHAVMRERMDGAAYTALPKWLREGIAIWAAGQTDERLAAAVADDAALADLDARFPGVDAGKHGVERYAEYGLALAFLEQRGGAGATAKLVQALVRGTSSDDALRQASGLETAKFVTEARAFAIAAAKKAEPEGKADYVALRALDKSRKYADVRTAAARFEKSHPKSPLLADVLYFRGKAERLAEDPAAATSTLERLTGSGEMRVRTHYLDEAWYQLGSGRLAQKQFAPAAAAFRTILRDFPDTSLQEKSLLRLAQALAEDGKKDEARGCLDRFDRSFPKSGASDEAKSLRAKLGAS
jgi:outer membrane protein assembly factor BamD (BamD/ComL family)